MNAKKKKVTIKDIADRVGVSSTTISRYLNGKYDYMSLDTRELIDKTITELNYRPNSMARSLRSKNSKLIGVIIHSLDHQSVSTFVRGISDYCYKAGYSTIIYDSHNDKETEKEYLDKCIDQQVDGIILSPSNTDFSYYHKVHENNIPIVMANRYGDDWKYDAVFIDHYALVTKALNHMTENGYEKIGFITKEKGNISTTIIREHAFKDFITKKGQYHLSDVFFKIPKSTSYDQLKEIVNTFRQTNPENKAALMAADVETLFDLVHCIQELNIDIPYELGVCGYDVWDWPALVKPSITTMKQPFYETGATASELIVRRINAKSELEIKKIKLHGIFSPRESTKKIKN